MRENLKEGGAKGNAVKAGLWYTVSAILLRSISILTTPIFTRLMSTNDYGIVTSFTSWYTLLLPICSLNLTYSVGKAKQDFPGQLRQYISSMMILSLLTTAVLTLLSFLGIDYSTRILGLDASIVVLLAIYLGSMSVIQLVQSESRFIYKYKTNVALSVIITVSSALVSIAGVLYFASEKYLGRIIGIVFPILCISIFLLLERIVHGKFKGLSGHITKYWKYGLSISLPLIVHVTSLSILTQADRVIIADLRGNAEAGIYGLAYQYAILISVITNALSEAWQPWFFDTYQDNDIKKINSAIPSMTNLGCIICIGCIAIAPEAIMILGGAKYETGMWVVPPITLAILCQYVYSHYVNIEMYHKKTKYISMGTIIAAVLNIALNYLFIPRFGFIAAGYATLASYIVLMAVHYFIAVRIMKVNMYNNIYLFGSLFVTIVISLLFTLIYKFIVPRYILIVLIVLFYFWNNKTILINMLKKKF